MPREFILFEKKGCTTCCSMAVRSRPIFALVFGRLPPTLPNSFLSFSVPSFFASLFPVSFIEVPSLREDLVFFFLTGPPLHP